MHQCVIAFVLCLANIVVNFLKKTIKKCTQTYFLQHYPKELHKHLVCLIFLDCNPDLMVCLPPSAYCLSPDLDREEKGKEGGKMEEP